MAEWDDHLRALGLEPPPEAPASTPILGTEVAPMTLSQSVSPEVRNFLTMPNRSGENVLFPTASPLTSITSEDISRGLGVGLGVGAGTISGKGFLVGAPKALSEIEQVLANLKAPSAKPVSAMTGAELTRALERNPDLEHPGDDEFIAGLDRLFSQAPAAAPSLSAAAIEKQLAENPGASIFDIAGVSSPYKPLQSFPETELFGSLGSFPREVPYAPPEQALAQGFVTPALHGTRLGERRWEVPGGGEALPAEELGGLGPLHSAGKDALRLPEDELGVHFGTPEQAHHFTSNVLGAGYLPRTYPTVLQTGKSLELPDMGTWELPKINQALDKLHEGSGYGVGHGVYKVANPEAHVGEFPASERAHFETIEEMRDYLHSKGYDSVNYLNTVEGPGQRSYIMFKPSPAEPKFVAGVRSPFAAFESSKLARPELAAGLAAAAASPVLFDEKNNPYFLTK